MALCAFLAVLFMNGFVSSCRVFYGAELSAPYSLLSALALIWAAIWWISEESKRKFARPVYCGMVLLLAMAWLPVVGYFALRRRGVAGLLVILAMFGVYLSGIFVAVVAFAVL